MSNIAIIGGGASGLIAAIFAAQNGHAVTILERMNRVGKKILATGNGRCNITNQNINKEAYHGTHKEDMMGAFSLFSLQDTIDFFENLGIIMTEEENGKMFPLSLQASSVLDNLRYECERLGVLEECSFDVTNIKRQKNGFLVSDSKGENHYFDRVILAAGGRASSALGSNGSGYTLAKMMGHTIVPSFAALCKIYVEEDFVRAIAGVKFMGEITVEGCDSSARDEILFTENGISGPAVFSVSRTISQKMHENKPVSVLLDMFPDIPKNELFRILYTRMEAMPYKTIAENLIGFLHKKLILTVLRSAEIDKNMLSSHMTKSQISSLCRILKEWKFEVSKVASFNDSQVCAGGVLTREVDPFTMQSKKCPGLYITGELLDIDGDCGGFNLQWAW